MLRLPRFTRVVCFVPGCCALLCFTCSAEPVIRHDAERKQVLMSDGAGHLALRLSYAGPCGVDQLTVDDRQVLRLGGGSGSGLKVGSRWFTSGNTAAVAVHSNAVTVTGIQFGPPEMAVTESWRFTVLKESIVWRIDRDYSAGGMLEDTAFPGFEFESMSTWTGALLGHGGVAWCKLFDAPNASYGVHNSNVTFWNREQERCLRITATSPSGSQGAVRFSRQASGAFSCAYSFTERALAPKHGLSRFRRDRQDIWTPFEVAPGRVSAELTLSVPVYQEAYDRGVLAGVDGSAIREICHTIARIGAIDELIMGSNGYYSGFAVLHEPWLAQMGLAIDDPGYFRAFSAALDFQRQRAIGPDGRVKSRWAGQPGDEMPGSYDASGFYECQWGWLMDSQTSWAINVAEQFDFNGDLEWLRRQKSAAEQALDYLLRRDSDGDGLVEMMTDSSRQAKGSDWIDVVWAAHENALVNAQLHWGLALWTDLEALLGDGARAERYDAAARKLKARFNQPIAEGGFWDPANQCYVYWRDKDDSVHGTNLVVPVNFSAVGYGLCDDPARRAALLDRMETLMRQEGLFFWPLCFTSYSQEDGHPKVNWPFPSYENGDIFLAWGELGTRAYVRHDPAIAVKYVKNVLQQYAKDGLSYQRYLRRSQAGAGDDILANNCSVVVGLYRNIYGVQPRHDRLYLEPHLVPELNGTRLKYQLRGQEYEIALNVDDYAVSVDGFTVQSREPLAIRKVGDTREYFHREMGASALALAAPAAERIRLAIKTWPLGPSGRRAWTEAELGPGIVTRHRVSGLEPDQIYTLSCDNSPPTALHSDISGRVSFDLTAPSSGVQSVVLEPAP
jgi:hypothetical protein